MVIKYKILINPIFKEKKNESYWIKNGNRSGEGHTNPDKIVNSNIVI